MLETSAWKLDRSSFTVTDLHGDPGDRGYWLAKTPEERLEALELMRQILYGYDPATTRLQRIFAVVERA